MKITDVIRTTGLRGLAFCCLSILAGQAALASQFVIVLHNGAGWQFQGAEKLTINGKPKLRRGGAPAPEIALDTYKRLPQELIGSAPIRLHPGGYFVVRGAAGWTPVYPDGAAFKGSASAQILWSSAVVAIQAEKGSKDEALRTTDIFAILPASASPAEAAVTFLQDEANFRGVGEASPAAAFDERMSLLVGVARSATGPAQTTLRTMISDNLTRAQQRADSAGSGRFAALTEGLRYVPVAESAFPSDAALAKLNTGLRDKLVWLNQRMAIVKALGAASEWDALIDKYGDKTGDLGDYDDAFADLHQLHERSAKESEALHTNEARRLFTMTPKQCVPAQEQIRLARNRNPGGQDLKALADEIRLGCITDVIQPPIRGPVETPEQKLRVTGYITSAGRSMGDSRFDEAESSIRSAEAVFAGDPRNVLARAKLLRARKLLKQAISMLDRYDPLVVSDPPSIEASAALRADIEYDVKSGRETARLATVKAETDGDYVTAYAKARDGVSLDESDIELLFHAGLNAAITRDLSKASEYWKNYVTVAASLPAENKRRTDVRNWLADFARVTPKPAGTPNWFSGSNNAPGLMYDPVSLTLNAHPAEIRASKKQTAQFDWRGGSLMEVRTVTQDPGTSQVSVFFDNAPLGKGVRRLSTEALDSKTYTAPRLTASGATGTDKGTYVALFTDPAVDPYMVEKLTGKRAATIAAGNPYFNPYVWGGVFSFLAEYDAEGRVKSATPLQAGSKQLDFQWDGDKLIAIVERGGEYRRDLRYDAARLVEETVVFRGKSSKISYKYESGRLASADCDADFSLDGRSRKVIFGN